ncbi:MAG: amidohydrolase family protein [Armatimonadetes bacterium]|nr:amidohydrolase family protein [Armatimonadota bacterium]
MIARDLLLAQLTQSRIHIAHVSTGGSTRLIREAKARGIAVTAETAPHYFALTDEAVLQHGANAKMNPPLRSEADRQAIAEAVREGLLSVIATDHAPHTPREKAQGLEPAPFGVVGLETALGVALTALGGEMALPDLLQRMTAAPAQLLGLAAGSLATGSVADLVVLDPEATWEVAPASFASLGRNTPFAGSVLKGRVWGTVVSGTLTYRNA